MGILRKRFIWIGLLVSYQKDKKIKFVVLKSPYMVSSSFSDHGTLDSIKPLLRLLNHGFSLSEHHCVYVKKTNVEIIFLILYVDDILLAESNLEMINATKEWLSSIFEIKDMGEGRYVLGVEIVRDRPRKLLGLCQKAYIEKVLERFRIHYSKLVDTPVEKGLTLSLEQCR